MAGRFLGQLQDVFAKIALHDLQTVALQRFVQRHLLADHRLAFDHQLGVYAFANIAHDILRIRRRLCPVHHSSLFLHGGLIALQVVVQIGQHMVAYRLALFAQRLEFGQIVHSNSTFPDKTVLRPRQRLFELLVARRARGVFLEVMAVRFHNYSSPSPIPGRSVISASTSAT